MERARKIANVCVGRAVLFGWLAIVCIMFSFSFHPVAAFRAGAVLALVMAAILIAKAFHAARQNPKHTEVWIHLDEKTKPRNDQARLVFRNMMREVYGQYAQGVFIIGCAFFVISLALLALGVEPMLPVPRRVSVPAG
jgi:hypothetical protein